MNLKIKYTVFNQLFIILIEILLLIIAFRYFNNILSIYLIGCIAYLISIISSINKKDFDNIHESFIISIISIIILSLSSWLCIIIDTYYLVKIIIFKLKTKWHK